jgi:hypothetical protein
MSPEIIFVIAVVAFIGFGLVGKLTPKRMPPQKSFKCGRCGIAAQHNDRTAEAWRNDKKKFFCQACHAKWLQSRPLQEREQFSSHSSGGSGSSGSSGCFGVVALFALLPISALFAWAYT